MPKNAHILTYEKIELYFIHKSDMCQQPSLTRHATPRRSQTSGDAWRLASCQLPPQIFVISLCVSSDVSRAEVSYCTKFTESNGLSGLIATEIFKYDPAGDCTGSAEHLPNTEMAVQLLDTTQCRGTSTTAVLRQSLRVFYHEAALWRDLWRHLQVKLLNNIFVYIFLSVYCVASCVAEVNAGWAARYQVSTVDAQV